jgi:hypothetical protein
MMTARALLVAVAAMLAAGRGAPGLPEPRAPLSASDHRECAHPAGSAGAARPPSQAYSALMP